MLGIALRVRSASRAIHQTFQVSPRERPGRVSAGDAVVAAG